MWKEAVMAYFKGQKARKTLAVYECQLFNHKYTDPTEEGGKEKQVMIG